MTDFVVLGTDTNAGKTTFALLWMAAFSAQYEYWKPVETGDSDTELLRRLVPGAHVHPPLLRLHHAVAPLLAARMEGAVVPLAYEILAARPDPFNPDRQLLIETFGSPLSPLNDTELQIALIRQLGLPTILVASSAIGAIGRVLQCTQALRLHQIEPAAIVLMGPPDPFAAQQIAHNEPTTRVLALQPPATWDVAGIAKAAQEQARVLETLQPYLTIAPPTAIASARPIRPEPSQILSEQQSRDLLERDRCSVWHPYTSLLDPDSPLLSIAAQDEFLHLADGRRVIDAISSWWTILHGHRHPTLMAALFEAAESFDHVLFAGVTHPYAIELAELLLETVGWPEGGRAFFSDNGSTAVEVALKMAYQFWCHQGKPGRTKFVGFEGGYHGDTFGAMAVSRDPVFFGRFEPLLFQAEIVPVSVERLEDTLTRLRGEVAAVIIEPLVQGAGGMRMHTPAVLRGIAEAVRRHGTLLIADEVMTAGGRAGPLWAHHAAEITPDLICAAKTLAGGVLPVAATLVAPAVAAAWATTDRSRTFFHGHSFTAHPLACAVAVANWRMLMAASNPVPGQMEAFWKTRLEALGHDPHVREVRVRGTIAAVELNTEGGYLATVGQHLRRHCLERGVFLRPLGSVLYAMPPFCTSPQSLEQIADAMIGAVKSLQ